MAIPQSKTELIEALETRFEKLMRSLDDVPRDRADKRELEGHSQATLMSVSDLISYLIGWNEQVLQWLTEDDAGLEVDFPSKGYKWNQLGQLAQKFYADYDALSYVQKLERLRHAQSEILSQISKRSNDELYGRGWYGKWTKGRMIQLNTSSPYQNANGRIRKWRRANNI